MIRYLRCYDDRPTELKRDFYKTKMDAPELQEVLELLLQSLHIPASQWRRYRRSDWTVSDFLAKLTRDGYDQAGYFLKQIEKKKSFRKLDLMMGGMLVAAMTVGILSIPAMSNLLDVLTGFLGSSSGIPILGMAFSGIGLLVGGFNNQFNKKKTFFNRMRDHAFSLIHAGFTFAAYALWLGSAPALPFAGACLFVAAAAVNVVKEVFCLAQAYIKHRNRVIDPEEDPVIAASIEARYRSNFIKHRNAAIINLATALVLTGIIAAWSFAPAGMAVTLGAFAAILVVCIVKQIMLKHNERKARESLQEKISAIENSVVAGEDLDNAPEIDQVPKQKLVQDAEPSPTWRTSFFAASAGNDASSPRVLYVDDSDESLSSSY